MAERRASLTSQIPREKATGLGEEDVAPPRAPAAAATDGRRVCVIGGGPSGTAVLRAFKSAADKGVAIPEVVCFEKQDEIGGQWHYSWRCGMDKHGEPVHSGMYRYLFSNGPKECLEFADYTFEEHFGKPIPSFPPREVLQDYIMGRIEKSGIKQWVQLNTVVRDVRFSEETKKFTVTTRVLAGKEQKEVVEIFDYVFVCTGHFSTPNVPYFPGIEGFKGRTLHAHDFKDAEEFRGQRIMVIGASYSAEDIASQCYKYGVKSVICSYRTAPMGFHWPDNFTTVPLLQKVDGKTCTFKDGSTHDVDAIIMCTGYKHHFPFLPDDLRMQTSNRLWIDGVYNGIFWDGNPQLMYIGMQDQWYTFNMFDAQAWYARDFVLGQVTIPDAEAQKAHFAKWRAREGTLATDEDNIRYQADYIKELMTATDYPTFDIEGTVKEFMDWEHNKHTDIMGFRDCSHKSVMTGSVAPVHHTKWIEALDDSMECYLKTPPMEKKAEEEVKQDA